MATVTLTPGANTPISSDGRILVAIGWDPAAPPGMEIDVSAFLAGAGGTVPDDAHFVFYGAPSSPGGAVCLLPSSPTGAASDRQVYDIALDRVPPGIASIDLCVTLHEGNARRQSFASLQRLYARLIAWPAGEELVRFDLAVAGMSETALTLVKLYRRDGAWKVRAVGQGFAGGLAPLARQYGVDVADAPPPPPPPPPTKPVSLTKITLEKRGQSVSLDKRADQGFGEILVTLNWNQRPPRPSGGGLLNRLLGGANKGIDLDLGCLWELEGGDKGVVQALGKMWGDYHGAPFIRHGGDDRTGASAEGEILRVNGDRLGRIKRILIFAFIYEGVPNWAAADGVVTMKIPGRHDIEVRLDNPASGQGMCAIAQIENEDGRLKVTKEERYFSGHSDMDRAYRWGMRWVSGSKD